MSTLNGPNDEMSPINAEEEETIVIPLDNDPQDSKDLMSQDAEDIKASLESILFHKTNSSNANEPPLTHNGSSSNAASALNNSNTNNTSVNPKNMKATSSTRYDRTDSMDSNSIDGSDRIAALTANKLPLSEMLKVLDDMKRIAIANERSSAPEDIKKSGDLTDSQAALIPKPDLNANPSISKIVRRHKVRYGTGSDDQVIEKEIVLFDSQTTADFEESSGHVIFQYEAEKCSLQDPPIQWPAMANRHCEFRNEVGKSKITFPLAVELWYLRDEYSDFFNFRLFV